MPAALVIQDRPVLAAVLRVSRASVTHRHLMWRGRMSRDGRRALRFRVFEIEHFVEHLRDVGRVLAFGPGGAAIIGVKDEETTRPALLGFAEAVDVSRERLARCDSLWVERSGVGVLLPGDRARWDRTGGERGPGDLTGMQ